MDTAFVIGNGESRNIFPIEQLKGKGVVYGCNAIYRDHPKLCDHIVAVNPPMYDELAQWHNGKESPQIHGIDQISKWNYICEGDERTGPPTKSKIYRTWQGGDPKTGKFRTLDFSQSRGSGCSAVLMAAESGIKKVILLAFDIIGAKQWEYRGLREGELSREQNNIYKNTNNYPRRMGMKAYLKYEWLFQLRQTFIRFRDTNFYFVNRKEYIHENYMLPAYFDRENIKCGTYADLQRWITDQRDQIKWLTL